jgi:hypothetical protein
LILLILLLCGAGSGAYNGWYGRYGPEGTGYNPLGIVLFIVLLLVVVGLIGGPHWGWYHW